MKDTIKEVLLGLVAAPLTVAVVVASVTPVMLRVSGYNGPAIRGVWLVIARALGV